MACGSTPGYVSRVVQGAPLVSLWADASRRQARDELRVGVGRGWEDAGRLCWLICRTLSFVRIRRAPLELLVANTLPLPQEAPLISTWAIGNRTTAMVT